MPDQRVFVIEGTSDWAEKHYFPITAALLAEEKIRYLYITDDSSTYPGDLKAKNHVIYRKGWILNELQRLKPENFDDLLDRVIFLDKSDPQDLNEYNLIQPDAVFIVTPPQSHAQIAEQWLARPPGTAQIFIEKPIAESSSNGDFVSLSKNPSHNRVFNVDHYLLRASWLAAFCDSSDVLKRLGSLQQLRMRMIEPGIEDLEYRQSTSEGLVLDMMSHLFALVHLFGNISSISLGGRNLWVSRCSTTPSRCKNETFGKVDFSFDFQPASSSSTTPMTGEASVGKGLNPSQSDPYPGKYLEIIGSNGQVVVNLGGDYTVKLVDGSKGATQWYGNLPQEPYYPLLREIINGSDLGKALPTFDVASKVLEHIEKITGAISGVNIPSYSLGDEYDDVLQNKSYQITLPP